MATRPTKNPRISFVPSDRVHALIDMVSKSTKQSKASIVSEILDEIAPVFQGQLDAIAAVASTPEKAREHVQDFANKTIIQVAQLSMDLNKPDVRTTENKKRAARGRSP